MILDADVWHRNYSELAMGGMYNAGAVYNHYLHRLMDGSTDELKQILDDWNKKPLWRKILSHCNFFVNWEMKLAAVNDLITARGDPNGDVAKQIRSKLESWRAERGQVAVAAV